MGGSSRCWFRVCLCLFNDVVLIAVIRGIDLKVVGWLWFTRWKNCERRAEQSRSLRRRYARMS
jgi:hypothetical protein